jgi:hypothetical protein
MCAVIPTLTQNCITKLNIFLDKENKGWGKALPSIKYQHIIPYIKWYTLHIIDAYLVLTREVEVSKGFSLTQISMLNHCSTIQVNVGYR